MVLWAPCTAMASRAPSSAMASRAPSSTMGPCAPCTAMASRAPSSAMVLVCLFCSGGPRPVFLSVFVLRGLQSAHPPSLMELLRLGTSLSGGGSYVSPLSCVCHVFPPHVSLFGLFPVLVKCHYELILVQPCLSNYLWFTCVFIVLSVHFDLVWSTRHSRCFDSSFPVFLLVIPGVSCPCQSCLVLPCPDVLLNTIIWVYVLVCVFLFLPAVCTVTVLI